MFINFKPDTKFNPTTYGLQTTAGERLKYLRNNVWIAPLPLEHLAAYSGVEAQIIERLEQAKTSDDWHTDADKQNIAKLCIAFGCVPDLLNENSFSLSVQPKFNRFYYRLLSNFQQRITYLRMVRGWSTLELARRAKLDEASVVAAENDTISEFTESDLIHRAIAFGLGVEFEDLLSGNTLREYPKHPDVEPTSEKPSLKEELIQKIDKLIELGSIQLLDDLTDVLLESEELKFRFEQLED